MLEYRASFAICVGRALALIRSATPLACGGLISCAATTTNFVRLSDGTWGTSIGCDYITECREQAADTCPHGYETLRFPTDVRPPSTRESLFVRCTTRASAQ